MKRCPTCNQTFDEDWLSFCTNDGTSLIEDSAAGSDLAKTMMSPAPPPPSNPAEPANWNPPSGWITPSGGVGAGQFPQPQPAPSAWQPPPPPAYAAGPTQGLAVAAMVLGIFTVTIGWCYLGIITGPIAIGLGIYSLIQIKNYPDKFTGRPLAIAGIVMGTVYFALVALIILVYGLATALQGIK